MKYCANILNFDSIACRLAQSTDEIRIDFNLFLEHQKYFLSNCINKKFYFYITKNDIDKKISIFKELKDKYKLDFEITFHFYSLQEDEFKKIKELGIPFSFADFIKTWDEIDYFVKLGANSIIIVEELGFQIKDISSILKSKNIKTIVIPNIPQNSINKENKIKDFFIRPEDAYLYEEYVDTLLLYGEHVVQLVAYQSYQKGEWFGDLKELFTGLHHSIDNRCILPNFGIKRLNCGKRCLKGGGCRICDDCAKIAETLSQRNIIVNNKNIN